MPANIPDDIGAKNRQFIAFVNALAICLFLAFPFFQNLIAHSLQAIVQSSAYALLFFTAGCVSFYCYRRASSSVSYLKTQLANLVIPFAMLIGVILIVANWLTAWQSTALFDWFVVSGSINALPNELHYIAFVQALILINLLVLPLYYLSSWSSHFLSLGILFAIGLWLALNYWAIELPYTSLILLVSQFSVYFLLGGLLFCHTNKLNLVSVLGLLIGGGALLANSFYTTDAILIEAAVHLTLISGLLLLRVILGTIFNINLPALLVNYLHKQHYAILLLSGLFVPFVYDNWLGLSLAVATPFAFAVVCLLILSSYSFKQANKTIINKLVG